jgi:uncharacterized protein (DUF362 family)
MSGISRREFCAGLGALALSGAGCRSTPDKVVAPDLVIGGDPPSELTYQIHGSGSSTVVEVRWAAAVDAQGRVDASRVQQMLQGAVERLTGKIGTGAWSQWADATRRIAIKVNAITSQAFTHPELAGGVAKALVGAGADPSRVTVWDRDTAGLRERGYAIDSTGKTLGYRCLGTDGLAEPTNPQAAVVGGAKVYLSPLLTESDLLVNVAALKDHSMAGVTLTLKNNLGMISGAERLHGEYRLGSGCEPGISDLAALPEIRGRLRLAVIDGLVGVCEGGPGPAEPEHVFRHAGLLVSLDPVALDRRGLAIIEARRAKLGLVPIAQRTDPNPSPPIHIDNAAKKGVSPA